MAQNKVILTWMAFCYNKYIDIFVEAIYEKRNSL